MAGDELTDRYHIVEELIILLEVEQAHRRTEATMAKQLVWWLFAHDLSNGQTRALLKDMSTAFARNYLRALDCPQGTIDRFNDGEPVVLLRESAEWHLVPKAVGD